MIFRCFGIFPLDRIFFNVFIFDSTDTVQVMQTVQIDLHKFRFTEPDFKLVFVLKKYYAQFLQDGKRLCNHIL